MAYRFTDTNKWSDTWFAELKPLNKLLFMYLCDQCDVAGFLELNFKKMSFDLSTDKQTIESSLKGLNGKIVFSKNGRYIFIVNFLKHQKNLPLNEKNRAHIGIIKCINDKIHLFDNQDILRGFEGALKPLARGTGIGKGNNIVSNSNYEGGAGGNIKTENLGYDPEFGDEILPLAKLKEVIFENEAIWCEKVAMKLSLTPSGIKGWLNNFFDHLVITGEDAKSLKDFKSHFGRWLKIELSKSTTSNNYANRNKPKKPNYHESDFD